MSIQAVVWAINSRVGDPVLKVLLMTLANYANTDNQTWHKQDKISFDTEIPVRTLRRKLQELVELGLISMEHRIRDDGGKASSMITILMEQSATVADGGIGQNTGSQSATMVAEHRTVTNRNIEYTSEFENEVWKPYPRKANTSKKKAFDLWRMLNLENQARVKATIPVFAADMRREQRPEDKIKHLQFWLSERIYETVNDRTTDQKQLAADPEWHKSATRDQWERLVKIWRGDMNWRLSWGPAPGRAGCCVPDDLLTEDERRHGSRIVTLQPQRLLECDATKPS